MVLRFAFAALIAACFAATVPAAFAQGFVRMDDDGGGRLLAVEHTVRAQVTGRTAVTRVEQVFRSRASRPREGTFLFPLPPGAAIQDFTLDMGGRTVHGELVGDERARRIYEAIVRRERDPALLEYVGRDLVRARTGWVDAAFHPAMGLTDVEAFGDDCMRLLRRRPALARCLALGRRVLVVVEGRAYRVR